jgi:hypothetical protein
VGIRDLFLEMHVRLLAGYAADAVIRAAVIAEASLKEIGGKPPDAKAMLGELIGELRTQLPEAITKEINWLNGKRISAVHATGQIRADLDDDARRAAEIAASLALRAALTTELELADVRRQAEVAASEPASSALLRLDRGEHRKALDDLLGLPRRVLVLLVHGEYGQGHDHFGQVMSWRLRAGPKGRWREIVVDWPQPSPSAGTRHAMLVESLAVALGVRFEPPDLDPTSPDGEKAWQAAAAPIIAALDSTRERLLVRHVLRWIGDGDDDLIEQYIKSVWSSLASGRGERIVVGLDLRRLETAGMPLMKQWRVSRTERRVAAEIAKRLEELDMPRDGMCAALPELGSVSPTDLAQWLRAEARRRKDAADDEAAQLHSTTRGGRFDLVVERLAALNLDRRESS